MKNILILSIVLLLTGCGEKFDASTESMIKISYNNILKDLKDNEKEAFQRQFSLYTQAYEHEVCMEGHCTEKNDIESLHGLSYGQVIDTVASHEQKILLLERQRVKSRLVSLHSIWKNAAEGMIQRDKDFAVSVIDRVSIMDGFPAVRYSFTNRSGSDLAGYLICLRLKELDTGNEVKWECLEERKVQSGKITPNGKSYNGVTSYTDIALYLDDPKYSVTMHLANLKNPQNKDIYPTITNGQYEEYKALMNSYLDIFEEVEEELGEAPWYN